MALRGSGESFLPQPYTKTRCPGNRQPSTPILPRVHSKVTVARPDPPEDQRSPPPKFAIASQMPPDDKEYLQPEEGTRRGYITRSGAERLHAELLRLLNLERPKVTAEVSAAAAQGDRSENAEYIYGKKRLREIDRRIHFLQRRLDTLTVVVPAEQTDRARVYFGATVTLKNDEGEELVYQVVGADEIDAKGGLISVDSPIGRALLGKGPGDVISVQRPRGPIELEIVEINYF